MLRASVAVITGLQVSEYAKAVVQGRKKKKIMLLTSLAYRPISN